MGKKSDEQLVAALITHGTVKDAAKAAGIAERTFYERMKGIDFKDLYANASADIIRGAIRGVNKHLHDAIDTVAAIMADKEVNPATRLQAAQTIINTACKLQDRIERTDEIALKKPPSQLERALMELEI